MGRKKAVQGMIKMAIEANVIFYLYGEDSEKMNRQANNLPSLVQDEELGDSDVSVRIEVSEIGDITREVI